MSFLRKAVDSAVTLGRTMDVYVTRPRRGICPHCNNLSPFGHPASSNNSMGHLDPTPLEALAKVHGGAVWLHLEVDVYALGRAARGYAKSVRPCVYCILVLRMLHCFLPDWFVVDGSDTEGVDSEVERPLALVEDLNESVTLILVHGCPVVVQTHTTSEKPGYHPVAFEIGIERGSNKLLPFCGELPERAVRSDDATCWDFVRTCVSECVAGHQACRNASAPTQLPKRLLSLGDSNDSIRLHEPGAQETGKYTALSHCWGPGYPIRTVKANVKKHKSRIKYKALDPTFKDAIEVTRRLGLRHIWIDSLCIIQDSVEDWQEQAALMASIYQHASVTIATASSPDPGTSVFRPRDEEWLSRSLRLGSEEQGEDVWVRRKVLPAREVSCRGTPGAGAWIARAGAPSASSALHRVWDGPLYARAWCFQEGLLSRRMIHYAPGAVIWECESKRQVEGEPAVPKALLDDDEPAADPKDIQAQWRSDVVDFTQRNMTFTSDRLVALAGVASMAAEKRNDDDAYLAGLWRSSLLWDLLWHTSPNAETGVPDDYVAPSWSWASLGAPVVWNRYEHQVRSVLARVEAAETTPKSPKSPFGDAADGSLTVHGPTTEASIVFDEELLHKRGIACCIVGGWEGREQGHFVLPDVRMYEADGLLDKGRTEKTYRRAEGGDGYLRYQDDEEDALRYDMKVAVLCLLRTEHLGVVGMVLGRSTVVPGAYSRLALVWNLTDEYVRRAEMKSVVIV